MLSLVDIGPMVLEKVWKCEKMLRRMEEQTDGNRTRADQKISLESSSQVGWKGAWQLWNQKYSNVLISLLANKDGKQDKRQPCVHCNYLKMFINELLFFFYHEKFEVDVNNFKIKWILKKLIKYFVSKQIWRKKN